MRDAGDVIWMGLRYFSHQLGLKDPTQSWTTSRCDQFPGLNVEIYSQLEGLQEMDGRRCAGSAKAAENFPRLARIVNIA